MENEEKLINTEDADIDHMLKLLDIENSKEDGLMDWETEEKDNYINTGQLTNNKFQHFKEDYKITNKNSAKELKFSWDNNLGGVIDLNPDQTGKKRRRRHFLKTEFRQQPDNTNC